MGSVIALILFTACISIYAVFNKLEDKAQRNHFNKNEDFLNSNESWKNKWKNGMIPYEKKWYHFGFDHKYEERFPYSSTLLVFLTDGEHLFQFFKNLMLISAFLTINWKYAALFLLGRFVFVFSKRVFFNDKFR